MDEIREPINLSGLNGIRINIGVGFNQVIEEIIERVVASPKLADVSSETIAELVHHAMNEFSIEFTQIRGYVDSCRESK